MSEWAEGSLADLVHEVTSLRVEDPSVHELATVRLYARGLAPTGKKPNKTKRGRPHFTRHMGEILVGRQNFNRQCVGVVTPELDGFVTSNAISAFLPNDGIDKDYALLVMASPDTALAADHMMPGTGQREISVRNLLAIPALVPPLPVQERVVEVIGAVDDQIAALRAEATALNCVLDSLRDRLPTAPDVPIGDVLTAIESGRSVQAGGEATDVDEFRILKISAVQRGWFKPNEAKTLADNSGFSPSHLVSEDDLLITRANTPQRVGYVAMAHGVSPGTYMPDLVWRLRPDEHQVSARYLEHALSSTPMRSRIAVTSGGTSTSMVKINKRGFSSVRIPVPELSEQAAYAARCTAVMDQSTSTRTEAERLRAVRASLLSALLNREIEIDAAEEAVA